MDNYMKLELKAIGENESFARNAVAAFALILNPTVSELSDPDWVALNTIVTEHVLRDLIPELKALGATGIIEYPLNKLVD